MAKQKSKRVKIEDPTTTKLIVSRTLRDRIFARAKENNISPAEFVRRASLFALELGNMFSDTLDEVCNHLGADHAQVIRGVFIDWLARREAHRGALGKQCFPFGIEIDGGYTPQELLDYLRAEYTIVFLAQEKERLDAKQLRGELMSDADIALQEKIKRTSKRGKYEADERRKKFDKYVERGILPKTYPAVDSEIELISKYIELYEQGSISRDGLRSFADQFTLAALEIKIYAAQGREALLEDDERRAAKAEKEAKK